MLITDTSAKYFDPKCSRKTGYVCKTKNKHKQQIKIEIIYAIQLACFMFSLGPNKTNIRASDEE